MYSARLTTSNWNWTLESNDFTAVFVLGGNFRNVLFGITVTIIQIVQGVRKIVCKHLEGDA